MKIIEHTLSEEINIYLENNKIDRSKFIALKAWPMMCGPQLSAVTTLKNIKNGVLNVSTTSSSAKSLLRLQKNRIIDNYNKTYPDLKIVDLYILKRG